MAKPLRPFVRGGGYYPSKKWIPLVRNGGYTTQNGGETEPVWATASGAIASFTTPFAYPLKKLVAQINPVQDLHGYDAPWPAGGSVNKLDYDTVYAQFKIGDNSFSGNSSVIANTAINVPESLVGKQLTFSAYIDLTGLSVPTAFLAKAVVSGTAINGNSVTAGNKGYSSVTFTPTSTSDVFQFTWGSGNDTIKIKDFQLEIGSSRTTWSPYSNICPISGWTGLSGQRTGANVFDQSNVLDFYVGGVGGTTVGVGGTLIAMPVKKGVTYTINGTIGNRSGLYYTYLSPSEISYGVVLEPNPGYQFLAAFPFTFTAHDTCTLCFYVNTDWDQTIADSIYAVVGSSASTYEEYTGEPISVTFPSTVYGGTDEVISGNGTSTMASVDLGTLTWTLANGGARPNFFSATLPTEVAGSDYISSMYSKKGNPYGSDEDLIVHIFNYANSGTILIRNTAYTTAADFKTAMSGVQLVYELATPQTFTHEGQSVDTLVGQNNIWVTSGDVEVTYRIE